uniref:1-Cys peroxiredoxin n=1 Tax=Dastarcus helophoroides TaxID=1169899 RepID=A0A0F7EXG5_9CUCU|nr:PRX6 protein [Dastarcus helophoroides]
MVQLGEQFPNFTANTTIGKINFHEWLGNSWGILFSHPADFTPVCTTELARVLQILSEFKKRGVKPIALSCDSVENHIRWFNDIKSYAQHIGDGFPYPIISDEDRDVACLLQMVDVDEKDADGIPLTARAVFIIDAKKKLRLSILYPATVGRNFDEILRTIDALQLSDKHKIATPADWKPGQPVMVQPSVSEDECKNMFPFVMRTDLPSGLGYIRSTQL